MGFAGAAGGVLRRVVYLGLAALAVIAFATFRLSQERAHVTKAQDRLVASRGLIAPVRKRLAADYTDKQNRLLADVPTDPPAGSIPRRSSWPTTKTPTPKRSWSTGKVCKRSWPKRPARKSSRKST